MSFFPAGSRPTRKAPAEWFTGTVWQDIIVEVPPPGRVRAILVQFEPGARTAWHTHPLGQTIHVTTGRGLFQIDGEPVREMRPGDTVHFEPNVRHWHGAAPDTAVTHLAISEGLDGSHVTWMEHVSEDDYGAPRAG